MLHTSNTHVLWYWHYINVPVLSLLLCSDFGRHLNNTLSTLNTFANVKYVDNGILW